MAESREGAIASTDTQSKLWGGRFREGVDPIMERFNRSIDYDKQLWDADITGSVAYSQGLARIGLLQQDEADRICEGLELVRAEWRDGTFEVKVLAQCCSCGGTVAPIHVTVLPCFTHRRLVTKTSIPRMSAD